MKKSQRGKNKKRRFSLSADNDDNDPIVEMIIEGQLQEFIKKFGRPPREDEPLFFDPDKDVPAPLSEENLHEGIMAFLDGAPPHIIYAYEKTGRVLLEELRDTYPAEFVAEYQAAIDEYFELKEAGKLP